MDFSCMHCGWLGAATDWKNMVPLLNGGGGWSNAGMYLISTSTVDRRYLLFYQFLWGIANYKVGRYRKSMCLMLGRGILGTEVL